MDDKETVNHPIHYNMGKIEVIEVIEDWQLGFRLGNVIKYVARSAFKGNTLGDLHKAKWFLEREIQKRTVQDMQKTSGEQSFDSPRCGVALPEEKHVADNGDTGASKITGVGVKTKSETVKQWLDSKPISKFD